MTDSIELDHAGEDSNEAHFAASGSMLVNVVCVNRRTSGSSAALVAGDQSFQAYPWTFDLCVRSELLT